MRKGKDLEPDLGGPKTCGSGSLALLSIVEELEKALLDISVFVFLL
jgi:hypothetical protein